MSKHAKILLLIVISLASVGIVLTSLVPTIPVAEIVVVDASSNRVAGAVVKPDGLRPKKGGGHYMWGPDRIDVKPNAVSTDQRGIARVPFPTFVQEHLETGEISFAVDHPDYCPDRPFRVVAPAPPMNASIIEKAKFFFMRIIRRVPIRPDRVMLKRGAILEVSGYAESKDKPLDEIYPQVPSVWSALEDVWRSAGNARLISKRIPEGEISFRLVHVVKEGKVFFSDDRVFMSKAEQTNSFHLHLKPGVELSGKLDGAVPRPVVNGRVIIEVISKAVITSGWPLKWHAWTPIDADGTFAFKSLPPGKLEIVGICEGYLSQDGAPGPGGHRIPQSFDLDGDKTVELAMEPAGTCEITVVDEAGNPVEGATATFWPNVTWGGTASTIFCSDTYATLDLIRSKSAYRWWETRYDPLGGFQGKSDKRGIAVVRNLPPGQRAVALVHPQYEIPITKSANNPNSGERLVLVGIMPETTSKVTVKVQKKGKQFLEPPR